VLDTQQVPLSDLGAPQIRQLVGLKDPQIEEWLRKHPALSVSSANKQAEIARYKGFLTAETIKNRDVSHGRALFAQVCASCHTLFGSGGNIGPELTGANRADIDYLLQNVLDPNALIGKDYQSTTVETNDGRVLVGMVRGDDANTITLKTLGDAVIIPRGDIKSIAVSEVSMMPEGLLAALQQDDVRDLFAYLGSPRQVPILATALNAGDFFNGSDLTRWRASSEAWRVDNGEIVGRGGAAQRTESLTSEMIAEDYQFTAQIKLTGGADSVGEIAFRGQLDASPFAGCSLSFGGNSAVNLWQYGDETPKSVPSAVMLISDAWNACEIRVAGSNVQVVLNGKVAFDLTSTPGSRRNGIAFYLRGQGVELRIKDPKLEVRPR
jgi:putative heme-binding domain-containing protein